MSKTEAEKAKARAAEMLDRAGIAITEDERANIEVAGLGLGELDRTGLQIIMYVNNEQYCAKELVLFPHQTCPEHRHPPTQDGPGKTETFRCRWGKVWLYVEGKPERNPKAQVPEGSEQFYTVFHEIELLPGEQYTVARNTLHWFQAGDDGAIVSEFSSASHDESDIFTDPRIVRMAEPEA